ncbi:MAG: transposase [Terriglobales bacterium]
MSAQAAKSISGISYFLNDGVWDHRELQRARLKTIETHHDLKPRSADLCIVDETCAAKSGKTFEKLDWVHDGRDGQIKPGYRLLGLLIVNQKRGIRYMLDLMPLTTKTDNFRSIWRSWIRLIGRNLAHIKAKVFVFDAGFRNQYLLKFIRNAGKQFVIRVLASMVLETADGKVKLGTLRRKTKRHRVRMGSIGVVEFWAMSGVMHAWEKEIPQILWVLLTRRQGFRNPLILATSQKLETLEEMATCYGQYLARWSIELSFKELKYDLSLEDFRVRSLKAIARWIALVVLAILC